MRDIKFRAFDEDKKEMIYNFKKSHYQLLWDEDNEEFFCGGLQRNGDWNQPRLMQFTGLRDRNGNKIFEGDILELHPFKAQVVFKDGAFYLYHVGYHWELERWGLLKELLQLRRPPVIVGNIYQNPELLIKNTGK